MMEQILKTDIKNGHKKQIKENNGKL